MNKKKSVAFMLVVVLVICIVPNSVLASYDTIATNDMPVVFSVSSCSSSIGASGRTISVAGTTKSAMIEDEISVKSVLQVKSGTSWSNVTSWSSTKTKTSSASVSGSYTGTAGKTYRVFSTHTTKKNGVTDTKYTYSVEKAI